MTVQIVESLSIEQYQYNQFLAARGEKPVFVERASLAPDTPATVKGLEPSGQRSVSTPNYDAFMKNHLKPAPKGFS